MTDMQRAFEAYDDALDSLWKLVGGNDHPIYMQFLSFRDSLALRAAPEGFVLVPVAPTEEMKRAGTAHVSNPYGLARDVWSAMLAARPQGVE